jgi:tRNA (guanine-N7-)-methyltransferase
LKDGGTIHLKTDDAVLYHYTLDLVKGNQLSLMFATEDLYGKQQAGEVYDIRTFYEQQFIEEGLNIHYLSFALPRDARIIEPENQNE